MCASLRCGFGQLQTALPQYLLRHLSLRERSNDPILVERFWRAFDHLDEDLIREFVNLDPWFEDGTLYVDGALAVDDSLIERVSACVMAAAKIEIYTSSRMLSQGDCL